jgi:tRNA-splicing ligase RtcB
MSVPGIVFASKELLSRVEDQALQQVVNVATLPGIVEASYAMPDIHWGYGFPIGGVAATDVERGGVISPGGVGFDISCGVRLLVSPILLDELAPRLEGLMDALDVCIPRGLGGGGVWQCDEHDLEAVLREGARAAVRAGLGTDADLARCEDGGSLAGADPQVSERALERGLHQVGATTSSRSRWSTRSTTQRPPRCSDWPPRRFAS